MPCINSLRLCAPLDKLVIADMVGVIGVVIFSSHPPD